MRIDRRQVVKEYLVLDLVGISEIDRLDFQKREIFLALFRRADLARNRVAGAEIEFPDLRRRYINIVRAGQIIVIRAAQEPEPVRQYLENAFAEHQAFFFASGPAGS